MNKKLAKYLSYLFRALTIIGAVYIFINDGNISAGYAVIPMLITLRLQNYVREENKKPLNKKKVILSFGLCIVAIWMVTLAILT